MSVFSSSDPRTSLTHSTRGMAFPKALLRVLLALFVAFFAARSASAATITNINPTSGSAGQVVTITGTGFVDPITAMSAVTAIEFGAFNGNQNRTPAPTFTVVSDIRIDVTVPRPTGSQIADGPILVSATTGDALSPVGFDYQTRPTITSVAPITGTDNTPVIIRGTNLAEVTSVTFGGVQVGIDGTVDPAGTQLTVRPVASGNSRPEGVVAVNVVGFGANGTSQATETAPAPNNFNFDYVPEITSISPMSGPDGTQVTITGTGFTANNPTAGASYTVLFGGKAATGIIRVNSTTIRATVAGGNDGDVTVSFTGKDAAGVDKAETDTLANAFNLLPLITASSVSIGRTGTSVTLTGTGLAGTTRVTIGGFNAPLDGASTDTTIKVFVGPNGGDGPIVATVGNRRNAAGATVSEQTAPFGEFDYIPTTRITDFSPRFGKVGTVVTIFGSGFLDSGNFVQRVIIGGFAASINSVTDTQITVTIVDNRTTDGVVSVVVDSQDTPNDKPITTSSTINFDYINSVTPASITLKIPDDSSLFFGLDEGEFYDEIDDNAVTVTLNCAQENYNAPRDPVIVSNPVAITTRLGISGTFTTGFYGPPTLSDFFLTYDTGSCGEGSAQRVIVTEAGADLIQGPTPVSITATPIQPPASARYPVTAPDGPVTVTRRDNHAVFIFGEDVTDPRTSESDVRNGRTTSVTVSLNQLFDDNIPTSPVFVTVDTGTTEAVLSTDDRSTPAQTQIINFTADNPSQTLFVQGVDDTLPDGDKSFNIRLTKIESLDPEYNNLPQIATQRALFLNLDDEQNQMGELPGVIISPVQGPESSLTTSEDGTTATFRVRLNSRPRARDANNNPLNTGTVVVTFRSNRTDEGTVSTSTSATSSPPSLTFTQDNFDTDQLVTVTGLNDDLEDGNQPFRILTLIDTNDSRVTTPQTNDPNYAGIDPVDVRVTNLDNDGVGVSVTPTALVINEGSTGTFAVRLNKAPANDVFISYRSNNTAVATVGGSRLTFTPANFATPQTIMVLAVDNKLSSVNAPATIVLDAAISQDMSYNGVDPTDVAVTSVDNDIAGITVTPVSGLTTTEAGRTATFSVTLDTQPSADVTIAISSNDTGEGTVAPATLTFTLADFDQPNAHLVTVTGVNDLIDDGDVLYSIVTAPAQSTDPAYNNFNASDVLVTNTDDDSVGVIVTPTTSLQTTEAGGTATFTVRLGSQPTSNVSVSIASSDTGEGTVSTPALTFTPVNYATPQIVTVTGVNDQDIDGDIAFTITTGDAQSTDTQYNGLAVADVQVKNADNDAFGIVVEPASGLRTSENGATATFTVALTAPPQGTDPVTIPLSSSDTSEGTVDKTSLTFTRANFDTPQTVTVTGVADDLADSDQTYLIVTGVTQSADTNFNNKNVPDVSLVNTNIDVAGVTVVGPTPAFTSEGGDTATFTVRLATRPEGPVDVKLTNSNPAEGRLSKTTLQFIPATFDDPQTVTVTGFDDNVGDGNVTYTISGTTVSGSAAYQNVRMPNVVLINRDNENIGVTVTPVNGLRTTEAGGTATFTVRLNSRPTRNVTMSLASSDPTEGTVSPASITFTPDNAQTARPVTVTGVDDAADDGDVLYSIVTGNTQSDGAAFNNLNAPDVAVTNTDDDAASIIVVGPPAGLRTTEAGGTATFTVRLSSQPAASVTIPMRSSNPAEARISPTSLTFTPANFGTERTVTVTGIDENVDDGDQAYTIITEPAQSDAPLYRGRNAVDVPGINIDNDESGFTLSRTSGLQTTEAGGTATFTIRLKSRPVTNVTIPLSSNRPTEGRPNVASLVFTPNNFGVPQTVTVTGIDDNVNDGPQNYTIVTGNSMSDSINYRNKVVPDVTATNTDNDISGFAVEPRNGFTTEAGRTHVSTIRLTSQPVATVTVNVSSDNTAEGTVSPSVLTFTPSDYGPKRVVVTGRNDGVLDGRKEYRINFSSRSDAPNFNQRAITPILLTNFESRIIASPESIQTNEGGDSRNVSVTVQGRPTAPITVRVSSSKPGEATVAPETLTFTLDNYLIPQVVTVTPRDDLVADGPQPYELRFTSNSADASYQNFPIAPVRGTNADNDTAGIRVTPTSGLVTSESGSTATFSMVLTSQPISNVVVTLTSSNINEGTVSPVAMTFTPGNYNTPQTAIVSGIDDTRAEGPVDYQIVTGAAQSDGADYRGRSVPDVNVRNLDNEAAVNPNPNPNPNPPPTPDPGTGGGGGAGDDYSNLGTTYALSVPFMDAVDAGATTTVAKAFTVPPVAANGTRNYFVRRFDPVTQTQVELSATSLLRRGEGYLLVPVSRGTAIKRPINDSTRKPTAVTSFAITLRNNPSLPATDENNGLNLIGFPFDPVKFTRADWLSATVRRGNVVLGTVAEVSSGQNPVMDSKLFTLDESETNGGQFIEAQNIGLVPFEGYYARTFENGITVTLQVQ